MITDLPDPSSVEGQELVRMLTPNEKILAVGDGATYGLHHYLIATNLRVIIIKPKRIDLPFVGVPIFRGIVSSSYSYRDISSVDMQEILPFFSKRASNIGFVRLNIRGNETYQVGAGWKISVEKDSDPWLPNFAQFVRTDEYRQAFRYIVDVINQQIALAHAPTPAAPSIPEQIQQLARLRDAGVITHQEFETKKAELLSRM